MVLARLPRTGRAQTGERSATCTWQGFDDARAARFPLNTDPASAATYQSAVLVSSESPDFQDPRGERVSPLPDRSIAMPNRQVQTNASVEIEDEAPGPGL
jgi:hypothetical protein